MSQSYGQTPEHTVFIKAVGLNQQGIAELRRFSTVLLRQDPFHNKRREIQLFIGPTDPDDPLCDIFVIESCRNKWTAKAAAAFRDEMINLRRRFPSYN